jgi:stringent starvation protein B
MATTSRRPYLIRAMVDWAVDNGLTPHLVVSADAPGVEVPKQYAHDGKITLNISARAAQGLVIGQDLISFSARFGGQPWQVRVPTDAVLSGPAPPAAPAPGSPPKRGKPQLKVVK